MPLFLRDIGLRGLPAFPLLASLLGKRWVGAALREGSRTPSLLFSESHPIPLGTIGTAGHQSDVSHAERLSTGGWVSLSYCLLGQVLSLFTFFQGLLRFEQPNELSALGLPIHASLLFFLPSEANHAFLWTIEWMALVFLEHVFRTRLQGPPVLPKG